MYLALTIFSDEACTVLDRVVHLEGAVASQYWLTEAAKIIGRTVKEGDTVMGIRVDRIESELCEA